MGLNGKCQEGWEPLVYNTWAGLSRGCITNRKQFSLASEIGWSKTSRNAEGEVEKRYEYCEVELTGAKLIR